VDDIAHIAYDPSRPKRSNWWSKKAFFRPPHIHCVQELQRPHWNLRAKSGRVR
jgi:hypothetical protein